MGPIAIVGWSALGVLVLLWLVVSFTAPGPRRAAVEWCGATCLYVALAMLFLNLVLRAQAGDNTFAMVAFGLLLLVFSCGGVVAVVQTLRSLRPAAGSQASATN